MGEKAKLRRCLQAILDRSLVLSPTILSLFTTWWRYMTRIKRPRGLISS